MKQGHGAGHVEVTVLRSPDAGHARAIRDGGVRGIAAAALSRITFAGRGGTLRSGPVPHTLAGPAGADDGVSSLKTSTA
jgi:hypothetical protein